MNRRKRLQKIQKELAELERALHRGNPAIVHIDGLLEDLEHITDTYKRAEKWFSSKLADSRVRDLVDDKFDKIIFSYWKRLRNKRKELLKK